MYSFYLPIIFCLVISTSVTLGDKDHCDSKFFVSSQQEICIDELCTTKSEGLVSMQTGSRTCLVEADGTITYLHLRNSFKVKVYKSLYFTCEPNLVSSTQWRCRQAGGCGASGCTPSSLQDNEGYPKPEGTSDIVAWSGCVNTGTCPGYCGLDGASRCTWSVAEVFPQNCKRTLEIESKQDQIELDYSRKNVYKTITLSASDPISRHPIPIYLISSFAPYRRIHSLQHLLEISQGKYIYAQACTKGRPVTGELGDYQLSLDKKTSSYQESSIRFLSQSCSVNVSIPDSPLRNLLTEITHNTYADIPDITIVDPETGDVTTKDREKGTFTFQLITDEIKSLKYTTPDCILQPIMTLGCTGCTDATILTIKANNLEIVGVVPFSSNCSVDSNTFVCQESPQTIKIYGSPPCCQFIYGGPIHKGRNFTVCPNYTFTGSLMPVGILTTISKTPGFGEATADLLTNPSFLSHFLTLGSITVVLGGLARIAAIWVGNRASKTLSDPVEGK